MPAVEVGEFRFGPWLAQPSLNRLSSDKAVLHLRPRTMDVLVQLAMRAGDVVAREELLEAIWPGQHVEDEGLTHCVAELREALGEHAQHPVMVETIPKRGYRLGVAVTWTSHPPRAAARNRGVVVLPFDDLGPDRDDSFSQGLTEAITSALATVPGLRVVSRTSATHLDRGMDLRAIAGKLNVSHALEGGVRRAGPHTVITARLLDAPGDVQVWSESFVEHGGESLDIQERTASAVAKALGALLSTQRYGPPGPRG